MARSTPRPRALVVALYLNALLLAAILLAFLARGSSPAFPFDSIAHGQTVQPIAGGAGFYLMPAQFDTNKWGCYVMDVDAQTLVAYVYDKRSGEQVPQLRLAAARSFASDRLLRAYNTYPSPTEIGGIVRQEREAGSTPTNDAGPSSRPAVPE